LSSGGGTSALGPSFDLTGFVQGHNVEAASAVSNPLKKGGRLFINNNYYTVVAVIIWILLNGVDIIYKLL
jgi:hypothetical protein